MNTQQMEELIPGVHFTRKEEQLLETLVRHVNQVVSRRFLLRNVWEYSDDARTRTVDVHIRRLRSKLAACPDLRISTIFGEGYVLEGALNRESGPINKEQPDPAPQGTSVVRDFRQGPTNGMRAVGRSNTESPSNGRLNAEY